MTTSAPESRRRRRVSIWVWPVAAIALVAFAGQLFGVLGAVLAGAAVAAALLFTAAEIVEQGVRRPLYAVAAVAATLGLFVIVAWQGGVPWVKTVAGQTEPPALFDARGGVVTIERLVNAELRGALLGGADLSGLDLRLRRLDGARAPGASFREANLAGASLRGVDLRGADLSGACLLGADLSGVDMTGASVGGATVVLPAGVQVVGIPADPNRRAASCR